MNRFLLAEFQVSIFQFQISRNPHSFPSPLTFGRLPLALNLSFRIDLNSPYTGACSALSPAIRNQLIY
jgi:hypothetical protein